MDYRKFLSFFSPYLINSIITTLFISAIAYVRGWYPFGDSSLLTIDLGQQYIDFFSLYREALLNDPSLLLYSFQKSIGGEMIGLWSYYLMSPFNLILLLFKQNQLLTAVTVLCFAKLIASSLSFQFFIIKKYHLTLLPSLFFSLSYAFMSYQITYLLNIMWLDGLIFLPLIALAIDYMFQKKNGVPYVILLTVMIISNYYIAYMICIFLILYTFYVLIELDNTKRLKELIVSYGHFILHSIFAASISSVILLPTVHSLIKTKAANQNFQFTFEQTYHFTEILSKLFNGSFVYDEIKASAPNLYCGALILILTIIYFKLSHIRLKEKLTALTIIFIFISSFIFDSLNQLWQGGQVPVWYYFRYSFTLSFFLINLSIKAYQNTQGFVLFKKIIVPLGLMTVHSIYFLTQSQYITYLDDTKIFTTLALSFLIIFILTFRSVSSFTKSIALILIVFVDLLSNSIYIVNEFGYVSRTDFNNYTQLLTDSIESIQQSDSSFYRIHKQFSRTKNEAMYAHYHGLDNFSSTIEASLPQLFGYLGLTDSGGSVTYSGGTLFTDDLFNIKYFIEPMDYASEQPYLNERASNFDKVQYPIFSKNDRTKIRINEHTFGLGFEVSSKLIDSDSQFKKHQPIENQELLLRLIDYTGTQVPYFTQHSIELSSMKDVVISDSGDGNYFTFQSLVSDVLEPNKGSLNYTFKTSSSNPYYLTIPSQLDNSNVNLYLDNQELRFVSPFRSRQITSIAFDSNDTNHLLSVHLQKNQLRANEFKLYEFDQERYQQLVNQKQNNQFEITSFRHHQIDGIINIHQDQAYLLFSIPYDRDWRVTVDGKDVLAVPVLNDTLLAIPIYQGKHEIKLSYEPKSITHGAIITTIGFISFIVYHLLMQKFIIKRSVK